MKDHPHVLDDFVEGTLPRDVRRSFERHIRSCAECRDEVSGLQSLLRQASALPREIAPARDLWPHLARRAGIGREGRRTIVRSAPRLLLRPAWAFAFSVGVCVLFTLVAPWSQSPVAVVRGLACEGSLPGTGVRLPANCDSDPTADVRGTLSRHAALVDDAIDQLLAALREDPSDLRLVHLLRQEYQRKASLVRTTARLLNELDADTINPTS